MLFVQCIRLCYKKDVRYASYANQRRAIRFWKLPQVCPEENEVCFNTVFLKQDVKKIWCNRNSLKTYGTEAFYDGGFNNNTPFSRRIAVTKEDDSFRVQYCGKSDKGFYSTKMIICPNEYGRIIFNDRVVGDFSGIWYYELITYNLVNVTYSDYRQKLFYRKKTDHEFCDMWNLRYHGNQSG